MEPVRIQKYLASIGIGSRRSIEKMMTEGKIKINGKKPKLGDKVTNRDRITVEGKRIKHIPQTKRFIAFHKPKGVESTMQKSENTKTLRNFDFGEERMYPVGRLDKNSRGLILMTNDGDLANQLTHPRYEHEKEYIVKVDKRVTPIILDQLSKGTLHIGGKTVKKAEVEKLDTNVFSIILKEGRNRQIRKMCTALNLEVKDLLRVRIANIELKDLKPGEFRELKKEDVIVSGKKKK